MDYDPHATDALLVCTACGTQFGQTERTALASCFVCDDPRQFTPPTGQAFATMAELRARHANVFYSGTGGDERLTSIVTEPKLAIGQRATLVRTPAGNVLWDCLTLLDAATVERIRAMGGLRAIVISHPHYFSSHVEWARAFACPVYMRAEDRDWAVQQSPWQVFLPAGGDAVHEICVGAAVETTAMVTEPASTATATATTTPTQTQTQTPTGAKAIRLGGHFPGSQVLLFDGHLLIADTLVTTPSGMGSWTTDALGRPRQRPPGLNSFAFMWSIPNMIPLSPDTVFRMWAVLKHHHFTSTHGAFLGLDITAPDVKQRVLDSMKIHTRVAGWHRQDAWDSLSEA